MVNSSVVGASLRERSKAKRREMIRRTGIRLFAERGYEATTIAEIAEAVELSPRTISLYFPTKADIALSVSDDLAARLIATFRDHPDADFVTAIDLWLAGMERDIDPELITLNAALFEANPALQSLSSRHLAAAAQHGHGLLLRQLGLPANHPMVAYAGGAIGGAIMEYSNNLVALRTNPDLHQSFIGYLRAIIDAARPKCVPPMSPLRRRPSPTDSTI
ncbi:TetR family transcriptional regulator [Jatrophihabitans sp. GAS493]|uniref:TetR/AcrR family transcriptional regulator n=1 Tax=Jatrophihabitans sp. GAS493 TaxID=1907575 RepID=UPI000BBFE50D|nr:TetR/AcrR family transcriptional regulator [Jatrophihabitans sp. GAS493]SOD72181.1 TetR family transcriptional regulator [Jatrophihabitans sp. GAS493]